MILYNITAIVDDDIKVEFKEWVHRAYLPEIVKSELFKSQSLLKMLNTRNEQTEETFCLQMIASSEKEINLFQKNLLKTLHSKIQEIWVNKIYLFESSMQYIVIY